MVEVIADPGETDPEGEDDHGKLDERSQYFQHSVAESNWSSLNVGHLVKPSLEVDNQEGAAVKAEAGMAGQKGEAGKYTLAKHHIIWKLAIHACGVFRSPILMHFTV